jgi:AhpD family alkylhydroperoxidase
MTGRLETFRQERQRLNDRVLARANLGIRRFYAIDERTYDEGALSARTKELLGLATSMALRCDDCVTYHLIRCAELGLADDEIIEAMNVALVVGGSIVIPHLRRAVDALDELRNGSGSS